MGVLRKPLRRDEPPQARWRRIVKAVKREMRRMDRDARYREYNPLPGNEFCGY
jgi:hypothetical protein